MSELSPLMWWGYIHVDGTCHVKRYFDFKDIEEAWESDFVEQVHGPIKAESRREATAILFGIEEEA